MKDFNIEQLAKKHPTKFLKTLSRKCRKTCLIKQVRKKKEHQPKIFKINFSMVTSIAAAFSINFGFYFLMENQPNRIF